MRSRLVLLFMLPAFITSSCYRAFYDCGIAVHQTGDGGFAVAGTQIVHDGDQFFVLKTDSAGRIEWSRGYGRGGRYDCTCMDVAADGGLLLAGSALLGPKSYIHVIRTRTNGKLLWAKEYATNLWGSATAVHAMPDGGFCLLSQGADSTYHSFSVLIRCGADGDVIRERMVYGDMNDLAVLPGDSILLAGEYSSHAVIAALDSAARSWNRRFLFIGDSGSSANAIDWSSDGEAVIAGYAPDTSQHRCIVAQCVGIHNQMPKVQVGIRGMHSSEFLDVKCLADGSYVCAGYTSTMKHWLNRNPLVVRYRASGDTLWTFTYGNSALCGEFDDLTLASDGGFVAVGKVDSSVHFRENGMDYRSHLSLMKLDGQGKLVWSRAYGGGR